MSEQHKPQDDHAATVGHDPVDTDAAVGHVEAREEAVPVVEDVALPTHDPEPAHEDTIVHAGTQAAEDGAEPTPTTSAGDSPAAPSEVAAAPVDSHGFSDTPHTPVEDAPVAPVEADSHPVDTVDTPAVVADAHPAEQTTPDVTETPATVAAPVAATAVVGAAAVAASAGEGKRPVWSDAGDAPFEDVDSTPVYARGKRGKKGGKSSGGGNEFVEIIKTVAFALLIAMVLRIALFQPFTIPSASMEPNLYEGDYIVVSKWSYGYSKHSIPFSPPLFEGRILGSEPKRGDIVVFKLPRDNKTDYIKRLIGLPGDRVQMIDNVLYINGEPVRDVEVSREEVEGQFNSQTTIQLRETLPEGREINVQDWGPDSPADNTELFEVPAGNYFMIGDNRDNSQDSRFDMSTGVGMVPAENLIGKAEIILFSWEPGASLFNPVSWFSKIRTSRFFTVLK